MQYSTSAVAIVAAMGISQVVAGPTHRHMHHHAKRDWKSVDFTKVDYSGVDWTKVDWDAVFGKKPAASAAPAAAPSTSDNSNSDSNTTEDQVSVTSSNPVGDLVEGVVGLLWHGLVGVSNALTSFGGRTEASGNYGDFYMGNVGAPWGSNMIKVDSEEGYDYTNNIINTSDEPMTVVFWNKAGKDGRPLSGGATASVTPALTIYLKPGENQIVAFDENSQVGYAQACDSKTFSGHFATSFGECNLTKTGATCNLSAILNPKGNTYDMQITNRENDCVSDTTQNSWITETETLPDSNGKDRNGSCYIPQNQGGHFTTKMGGQQ